MCIRDSKQLVHRYLQNNICYFRSPISPWRGPQWNSLFWAFFSRHGPYFYHTKNQPLLRPPSTFSEHWPWFWPYLLSEKVMKFFWYKIWAIVFTKCAKLSGLGVPWVRNNRLLLDFLRLKTLLNTLTYSAVEKRQTRLEPTLDLSTKVEVEVDQLLGDINLILDLDTNECWQCVLSFYKLHAIPQQHQCCSRSHEAYRRPEKLYHSPVCPHQHHHL